MVTAKENSPIKVYLIIIMGICYLLGILEFVFHNGKFYQILNVGFTFFPVISAAVTRRLTGAKARYHISLKVCKDFRACLIS